MATSKKPTPPDVPANPELMPTPILGQDIWFYPQGDASAVPCAGKVTQIETIGRIKCIVWPPNGIGSVHLNVWYVNCPEQVRKEQWRQLARHGGWGYVQNRVPKGAYDEHLKVLADQAAAREHDQKVREQKAAALKAEQEAYRKSQEEAQELAEAGA